MPDPMETESMSPHHDMEMRDDELLTEEQIKARKAAKEVSDPDEIKRKRAERNKLAQETLEKYGGQKAA